MAIPGRLKIRQGSEWVYVGFGPQGASGYSGWSGAPGSGGVGVATATILLSAQGGLPAITNGCSAQMKVETSSNDVNYATLDFDPTTQQYAVWNLILPVGYPTNGTFTATFYWTASSGTAAQTCIWGIQAVCLTDSDAMDTAYGTAVEVSDAYITANDLHVSSVSGDITAAGTPAAGELISFRVYRKAATDTLTGVGKLIFVKLEYTTG